MERPAATTAQSAPLSGTLATVAAAVGPDAATKLAVAFGGTRIYVPKGMRPAHPIARAIGIEAAKALAAEIGHGHLYVPFGPASEGSRKALMVRRLIARGLSNREIAHETGVDRRTVQRARRRMAA